MVTTKKQRGGPKEAVLIYIHIYRHHIFLPLFLRYVHQHHWDSAQCVAEKHSPESLPDVLIGQVHPLISSIVPLSFLL